MAYSNQEVLEKLIYIRDAFLDAAVHGTEKGAHKGIPMAVDMVSRCTTEITRYEGRVANAGSIGGNQAMTIQIAGFEKALVKITDGINAQLPASQGEPGPT